MPTWLRREVRADPITALGVARQVSAHLGEGLRGPGGRAAARRLRWLLRVRAVGLAGPEGAIEWSGPPTDAAAALELVGSVLNRGKSATHGELAARPLVVDHDVAGVLVVDGVGAAKAVREAAWLVENALERGRLELSEQEAARSELRALRAEMSPHFVYNALTVIASSVRSDPELSRELLLDFADYARYSLGRHGEYTTVADEFEAIETYLVLQRAVMGDRLQVQIRVVPDVLAVPLPYLVLQPLVENAIRHGLEPLGGGGTVSVHGEARNGDCMISIEDDGVGMAPAQVEQILAGKASNRVGLSNADRRLRTAYGPWYGLVVETERDAGTRVVVRVPLSQPGVRPS
ncbi:histidine kinase [Nocardia sp. CDC153]|uniref:sensor histidine kinase n=1 Tax=Nocardia sp. CDC153 TaxID=3112167 RepID=UPI002DBDFB14|nr:histidine kinase [Nocardia sp. CDC153]MEC3956874.1 histidine kinase [Nocardia sp. CDC153]